MNQRGLMRRHGEKSKIHDQPQHTSTLKQMDVYLKILGGHRHFMG